MKPPSAILADGGTPTGWKGASTSRPETAVRPTTRTSPSGGCQGRQVPEGGRGRARTAAQGRGRTEARGPAQANRAGAEARDWGGFTVIEDAGLDRILDGPASDREKRRRPTDGAPPTVRPSAKAPFPRSRGQAGRGTAGRRAPVIADCRRRPCAAASPTRKGGQRRIEENPPSGGSRRRADAGRPGPHPAAIRRPERPARAPTAGSGRAPCRGSNPARGSTRSGSRAPGWCR